jgi:hypothetical protein
MKNAIGDYTIQNKVTGVSCRVYSVEGPSGREDRQGNDILCMLWLVQPSDRTDTVGEEKRTKRDAMKVAARYLTQEVRK